MHGPVERPEVGTSLGEPTLLFTDIEGSTRLLDELGDEAYAGVLATHHDLVRDAIARYDGTEQGTEGDSFFATFDRTMDGVAAAVAAQRSLADARWPGQVQVRVRMGLHAGPVALVSGNLVGMSIHAASRIESAAHGGQIVVSAAVASRLHPGEDLGLRRLGSHQLRGIAERVELYQVDVPGLSHEFPPLATDPSDTVPVPRFLAAFVGRAEERSALGELVAQRRIVTITGPPGVGKTRLAATVLEGRQDVAFVDLASLDDPAQVTDRVIEALGLRSTGDELAMEVLARHLGATSFALLIDNCEHVIEEVANVVTGIVLNTSSVHVLCTSREPLAIDGEVVWPLEPLCEAEELFVERARAADATTRLRADDRRITRICERLDRLPLAVELAAAQVGRMPLDEVVARLDELTRQLRSGRRDMPSRHRTLRAAIDWSVRLLDPRESSAFRRLGVMRGAFDLTTAEAVTDASAEVIATLHERSLLGLADQGNSGRFRMLETVRDAALELLEAAGEAEEATAAHAHAFQARAAASLHGQPTHLRTMQAIDDDADNFRHAVQWLSLHEPTDALTLAVDLENLWTARLSPNVARQELGQVLDAASDAPAELRASALMALADINRNCGRVGDARRAAETAVELAGGTLTHDRYSAPVVLGQILAMQGELDAAERLFEDELRRSREIGDDRGVAGALREIANVALERNRPEEAAAPLDEAIQLSITNEESRWMLAVLASDRARAALALGRFDDARAEFMAAMLPSQQLGIGRAVAGCSLGLAQVERASGHPDRAWPLLREAFRFYRDHGDTGGLAHCYVAAAMLQSEAGRHDVAVQLLAATESARKRIEIAMPGSERPGIEAVWEAAATALGEQALKRFDRTGRAASEAELAEML